MAEVDIQARWKEAVRTLGRSIGYGNLMELAQENWREHLTSTGAPAGGELVVGPCAAMTVPSGCKGPACDWCCGSGWLVRRVKKAKQESLSHER